MNKMMLMATVTATLFCGAVSVAGAQSRNPAPAKQSAMGVLFLGEDLPGATEGAGGQGPLPAPKVCKWGEKDCRKTFITNCASGGGVETQTTTPSGVSMRCNWE